MKDKIKIICNSWYYGEFWFLIFNYLKSIKFNEIFFDLILPILLSLLYYIYIPVLKSAQDTIGQLITFNSILLGFTIASLSIILTSNSERIKKAKEEPVKRCFKTFNMFQILLIPFFYISFIGFIELLISITTLFLNLFDSHLVITLNVFFILHILSVGIRNITNLFLILFQEK